MQDHQLSIHIYKMLLRLSALYYLCRKLRKRLNMRTNWNMISISEDLASCLLRKHAMAESNTINTDTEKQVVVEKHARKP